jgi:hypothetical protein
MVQTLRRKLCMKCLAGGSGLTNACRRRRCLDRRRANEEGSPFAVETYALRVQASVSRSASGAARSNVVSTSVAPLRPPLSEQPRHEIGFCVGSIPRVVWDALVLGVLATVATLFRCPLCGRMLALMIKLPRDSTEVVTRTAPSRRRVDAGQRDGNRASPVTPSKFQPDAPSGT